MNRTEAMEQLLRSFRGYYTINTETPVEPFAAEAEFRLHAEQYFLIKSAKMAEADTRELVFFASVDELTVEKLSALVEKAWEEGIARVEPKANHKRTDIALYILADHIPEESRRAIRRLRRSKSYKMGFHGYTHYRLVAYDPTSGAIARNAMGDVLEKTIRNIFH